MLKGILSIVVSFQHRLKYLNDYFVECDDVIYLVVLNYLSMVLVDNPLTLNYDRAADSFAKLMVTNTKTLTVPANQTQRTENLNLKPKK